ncbi:alkaline phosphatase D family protein [Sphingosinithalassobacter portus]|uniref:alkaline phosphatase D family protein n=1 Tax=Stakelama portus TaxID=2676234 RepID=UPI000D6DFF7C|nr:alkaline phosphatase D family protein [Sphingosinithalassobacter portus]
MASPLFSTNRRAVLRSAGIAPALLLFGRSLAASDPFSLGVASGDPAANGFVIWTRIAPDPLAEDGLGGAIEGLPVQWEVAADPAFRAIVRSGETRTRLALGGAIHIEVDGLQPDRPYWYRFIAQGVNSDTGRAWTAPAAQATPQSVRFTAASCSHWEYGYFAAYRHMAAEEDSRFTLFLGDYIYENAGRMPGDRPGIIRSYGLPEADSLSNYRRRYALHRTDPDLRALHAAAPAIAIWDDHELQNDYSGIWSQEPALTPAKFAERRRAAYRAFCENLPMRLSRVLRGDGYRIYRRMRWGDLAQFDMLDGRQFRSPPACIEGQDNYHGHMAPIDCADLTDPSRTFLGFTQERWLYDGWANSRAQWNLLVQNLLVAPMLFDTPAGRVIWTDSWNGFGAARQRMIDAMVETGISNPVTLAGDYHSFWTNNLYRDFNRVDQPPVAAEFVVSSITSSGPPQQFYEAAMPDNPQIRFFDSRERGYMRFDLNRERLAVDCMKISDRADRNAALSILHSATVENGRPGLA